jgi:hypothetical protein
VTVNDPVSLEGRFAAKHGVGPSESARGSQPKSVTYYAPSLAERKWSASDDAKGLKFQRCLEAAAVSNFENGGDTPRPRCARLKT